MVAICRLTMQSLFKRGKVNLAANFVKVVALKFQFQVGEIERALFVFLNLNELFRYVFWIHYVCCIMKRQNSQKKTLLLFH